MQDQKKAARAWTTQQARLGRRSAFPVIGFGLAALLCSVAQAGCIAGVLADTPSPGCGAAMLSSWWASSC